ncbi:MAG: thioredoxin family protein [Marinifilaceae bacterium]|nr:thioredoxin family protein [Marinifilaceae bacterium]
MKKLLKFNIVVLLVLIMYLVCSLKSTDTEEQDSLNPDDYIFMKREYASILSYDGLIYYPKDAKLSDTYFRQILTPFDYLQKLEESRETPVIIFVYSTWSKASLIYEPFFESAFEEFPKMSFYRLNCDYNQEFSLVNNLAYIPTIFIIKDAVVQDILYQKSIHRLDSVLRNCD